MSWWLSVFFLINGQWQPGANLDGWQPRAYPTEEACLERKQFAEKECRNHPLDYDAMWFCTEGKPLSEVPQIAGLDGTESGC
jgi:hypothetical protein